jgi:serine/threonine protein kinase
MCIHCRDSISRVLKTDTMNNIQGQTIRSYEFHEQIASGGFGVVYRATQRLPIFERDVAIKIILPQYANLPDSFGGSKLKRA